MPVSRTVDVGPDRLDHPIVGEDPPVKACNGPVHAIEIAAKSSALHGMKVREVTTAEVDPMDLMEFVHEVSESGDGDGDGNEEGEPVMAGERAHRFSELPPELDGEPGPSSRRPRIDNNDEDYVTEVGGNGRKIGAKTAKTERKSIRMMTGHGKFDFVGAFRDAPVIGLNWGSFFDLAPMVKKDICRLLVQERAKSLERAKRKGKGKQVTIDRATQGGNHEEEVLAVATDRNLGDVANFYTKGTIRTPTGCYQVSRILVDAGSVVNLMPIRLLRFMGAKLQRSGGMVIRTATNALAKIAYCADLRVTVAGVPCDLRIYALPDEYKPTYPMLLSRRWLQAVRAKGDYGSGQYYIASSLGTQVRIPSDEGYKRQDVKQTSEERQPRVPIVLRDRTTVGSGLSAEVEEELELQQSGGTRFFEDLIALIKQEADRQIREENDEEEEGNIEEEESEN
ncbi:hypothetical protein L873DRAFT_616885 [Choiromyces venosus 120613-1]|uniref:Uncharacterized protein n=1 Tax=Choiromyces venosus 120613-1 TaxID=1336337 RepID=A0A3N4IV52_9PEZI|nr:hypothetical protein L873DRAFT_616885 [Choiromyces venosus 120613-1]